MGPINYSVDVATPFASVLEGYKAGAGIRNDQRQQAQAELQRKQQEQQGAVIQQFLANKNPTAADVGKAMLAAPSYKDQLSEFWKTLSPERQQNALTEAGQIANALSQGKPEIAAKLLNAKADAMEASGMDAREVEASRMWAKMATQDPDFARSKSLMYLHTIPGGDKVVESITKYNADSRAQQLQPSAVAKANAEATTAEVAAGNAPTSAALENETKAQAIKTAEAQRNIADLNVQISQANSETQRGQLILERDKWQAKLNETQQGGGSAAQDAFDSAQALLDQIKGVRDHKGLEKGTGTGGGILSFFNSSDGNDFRKAVEGLKSPIFLNELSKLKAAGVTLGSVTEAEGKKLEQRIANLDVEQSTPAFKNQVGVLMKDTEKFIEKIKASGKLPTSGGAYLLTHPVYGKVTDGDVNRLMSKYPGSTREQVLNYLKQTSAKPGGASGAY